jgi:hypothetical protein
MISGSPAIPDPPSVLPARPPAASLTAGGTPEAERRRRLEALDRWLGNGHHPAGDAANDSETGAPAAAGRAADLPAFNGLGDGAFPASLPDRLGTPDH